MILPGNLRDLQGSTVSVNYIGPKNAPYKLTGEFQRIAFITEFSTWKVVI